MKNNPNLLIIFILSAAILLHFSFGENLKNKPKTNHTKGEIIIGFNDEISKETADDLIKQHNLTWESNFPKMFSCWAKVLNGSPDDYINKLKNSSIVLNADVRGKSQSKPDEKFILITFNIKATHKTARELIDSLNGLGIDSILSSPKLGIVKVPEGEEFKWIEIFKKEPIVKYAELNQIISIDTNK